MTSEELHKRRGAAVARGVTSVLSAYVDRAGGGSLHDVDGREWIDFGSGIAVTSVGNAAPRVVAAVGARHRGGVTARTAAGVSTETVFRSRYRYGYTCQRPQNLR
jgi:4-aminobutyrate aminotransferase-like enzyme